MSEEQAFREQMRRNPDDDTARLVYADWLDEHDKALPAARIRWWVDAKTPRPPTSGAGAALGVNAGRQEREGLPEWVARLNQVRGVREALAETNAGKHPGMMDAIHEAEMHAYGLSSIDDLENARTRAHGINYAHTGTHAYDAAQALLKRDALQDSQYPPWWAQHSLREAVSPAARFLAHDNHQLATQRLVEHTHNNPPPTHEADALRLARPLGWLKDKASAWFGKKETPRAPQDGVTYSAATHPTEAHAEQNAVAQALRLLGAPEHMSKVGRYTAHVARFVKENPEHAIVKAYKDKAGVIGGTAGPELTEAVKPLVGVANLLLAAHGLDERFRRPETESARAAYSPPEPSVDHATSATEEPPIALEGPPAPTENMHATVKRLLEQHKDKNKALAELKAVHGLTHQEAREAMLKWAAAEGERKYQAFKRASKKNPDAKLAKPKVGEALRPEHLGGEAHGRGDPAGRPVVGDLEGTGLAYHLRSIGQKYPKLSRLTDTALTKHAMLGSDPFAQIGEALPAEDPRKAAFNWSGMRQSLAQDAAVDALVKRHVLQQGKSEREYFDSLHRGLSTDKAGNAKQVWDRLLKHAGTALDREKIAASIARLKDRALDREYSQATAGKAGLSEWRGVMGAHPAEEHQKYDRKSAWISAKIAKLVGEGKDQKQAAAIAYNMWGESHGG